MCRPLDDVERRAHAGVVDVHMKYTGYGKSKGIYYESKSITKSKSIV